MATLYGDDFVSNGGAPGSAGTNDVRQDRPNEGLSGQANTHDTTATSPTRGNFDTYKAIGKVSKQACQIDTSQTSYQDPWTDLKRADSSL